MNANELADELEKLNKMSLFDFDAAFDREKADATVAMLRQQQAEIERLKGADALVKLWTSSQWFKDAMENGIDHERK